MTADLIFQIIISILILEFILNKTLGFLNYRWYDKPIPSELEDVYDDEKYQKSQEYKKLNYRFGLVSSAVSFVVIITFILLDGFAVVDILTRGWFENELAISLAFFAVLGIASELLRLPFSIYQTFVIEEKYGFNNTSVKTFVIDKLKSYLVAVVLGGALLAALIYVYQLMEDDFWWVAWLLITTVSLLLNLFYARLIVPLFNKQEPLAEGDLRDAIERYAATVGFALDKIFVIDGSKRSTKANAYFSGFGSEKRVTLYDTLISKLSTEEIVAVLAHEVGHYKKKHIIYNLIAGIVTTGITLFIFSIVVDNPLLARALGVEEVSFHVGLVAFGLLYSPISMATSLLMNVLSRRFEYQADAYAAKTYDPDPLISGLKSLSSDSLGNLTPHPSYVFFHYSHPPLYRRITAMT